MSAVEHTEVMICPASGTDAYANIQKTVAQSVAWSVIAIAASDDALETLGDAVEADGRMHFWGFRENSRDRSSSSPKRPQSWQRLHPGTVLVFVGRGRPTYTAAIGGISYDPGLSQALWGSDEFCWVVRLTDVVRRDDLTDDRVRDAAGFQRVQMSMPVREERRAEVLALVGEGARGIDLAPTVIEAPFDPDAPLSVRAEVERRIEQGWLRRALVRGDVGECELCGDRLPRAFVRAAHIKKRSLCTEAEKRDLTNVLVACVTCDVAFERGWLSLDDAQIILVSGTQPTTPELRSRLDPLAGRSVQRPLNPTSIRFHRERSFTS